ncbi:hypothetical protein O3Q52_29825 [Streptomyces sp. ActVer]|uniref:hypothetical protein n=1 Tax=Streptomyces sp. ActVer TaxID=3014558 RepID=UPI0022B527B4|nr:hypothetical protein [Streptomyces sp. ActVer]MCZ4512292.1 hypothetical protein [Streptomyces sp. ActVer]
MNTGTAPTEPMPPGAGTAPTTVRGDEEREDACVQDSGRRSEAPVEAITLAGSGNSVSAV